MASFHLRIPDDLHELLQGSSAREERSMQREIIFRLRKSFMGEVASARTREVAAEVPEPDTPESVAVKAKQARAVMERAQEALAPPAPVSLPDVERRERHEACLKSFQHHIYHGGKPCPLCGYPA